MKVMIGSDPEYWLYDPRCAAHIPAEYLLPCETGQVNTPFFDGFQAEITTKPVDDMSQVHTNLKEAVQAICQIRERGIEPVLAPAIKAKAEILDSAPPSVFAFGCSPSLNAYTNEVRNSQVIHNLHSKHRDIMMAGGHIHLGMPNGELKENPSDKGLPFAAVFTTQYHEIIRIFETVGGTLLTALECSNGQKPLYAKRRLFYGLSGEYRQTRYGIEMRSPSCAWMLAPEIAEMIYASAAVAYFSVFTDTHAEVMKRVPLEILTKAINSSDVSTCLNINKIATDVLTSEFGNKYDMVVSEETSYKGIWSYIRDIFEKASSKLNFYERYNKLHEAWEL